MACRSAAAHANMVGSCFTLFKLDHSEMTNLAVGNAVSENVFAGGHSWSIRLYPRGSMDEDKGEYISLFLDLRSRSAATGVRAIFQAFVMDRDGRAHSPWWSVHDYQPGYTWGWRQFAKRADIEASGWVTLVRGIVVVGDDTIAVPPSDVGSHLGHLLDDGTTVQTDVSFVVGGQTFHAHRAVLAARSPVFRAQLLLDLASTADAKTPPIVTLQDIEPATFQTMLRYMYTDALPEDDKLGDSSLTDLMQRLLAAADRFAVDRMKLMCARKLWDNISVDTFASTISISCAETYNLPRVEEQVH